MILGRQILVTLKYPLTVLKPMVDTVFTRKSAYAQKSASLELAPPF